MRALRGLVERNQSLFKENKILSRNVYELEKQLQRAYKKIKELINIKPAD